LSLALTGNNPANPQIVTAARTPKGTAKVFVEDADFPSSLDVRVQTGPMMAVRRSTYRCAGTLTQAGLFFDLHLHLVLEIDLQQVASKLMNHDMKRYQGIPRPVSRELAECLSVVGFSEQIKPVSPLFSLQFNFE